MLYLPASSVPPGRQSAAGSAQLLHTKDLDQTEHGAPIAKMFVSGTGGSIRRLIGSAHRHVIAMRRDPQMAHGQAVEGVVEGPAMIRCATDPDIVFYQFQPFRLVLMVGAKMHEWICDVIYVTRDGSVWVREIKRSAQDLADPEYVAKLEAVAAMLGRLGWNFKPWLRAEIEGSPERQVNSATIYFDRSATIDDLIERFERLCLEMPTGTFGELVANLAPDNPARSRAAAHRLIMMGRVWVDLERLVEDWSEVTLRPSADIDVELPFA